MPTYDSVFDAIKTILPGGPSLYHSAYSARASWAGPVIGGWVVQPYLGDIALEAYGGYTYVEDGQYYPRYDGAPRGDTLRPSALSTSLALVDGVGGGTPAGKVEGLTSTSSDGFDHFTADDYVSGIPLTDGTDEGSTSVALHFTTGSVQSGTFALFVPDDDTAGTGWSIRIVNGSLDVDVVDAGTAGASCQISVSDDTEYWLLCTYSEAGTPDLRVRLYDSAGVLDTEQTDSNAAVTTVSDTDTHWLGNSPASGEDPFPGTIHALHCYAGVVLSVAECDDVADGTDVSAGGDLYASYTGTVPAFLEDGILVGKPVLWDHVTNRPYPGVVTGRPASAKYIDGISQGGFDYLTTTDKIENVPLTGGNGTIAIDFITNDVSSTRFLFACVDDSDSIDTGVVAFVSSGDLRVQIRNNGSSESNLGFSISANTRYVAVIRLDGTDLTARLYLHSDGSLVNSNSPAANTVTVGIGDASAGYHIGAPAGSSDEWNNDESDENVIYSFRHYADEVLSDAECDAIGDGTEFNPGGKLTLHLADVRTGVFATLVPQDGVLSSTPPGEVVGNPSSGSTGFDSFSPSDYLSGVVVSDGTNQTKNTIVLHFTTGEVQTGTFALLVPEVDATGSGWNVRIIDGFIRFRTVLNGAFLTSQQLSVNDYTEYWFAFSYDPSEFNDARGTLFDSAGVEIASRTDRNTSDSVTFSDTDVHFLGYSAVLGEEPFPGTIHALYCYADAYFDKAGQEDLVDGTDPTGGGTRVRVYDGVQDGQLGESDSPTLLYPSGTGEYPVVAPDPPPQRARAGIYIPLQSDDTPQIVFDEPELLTICVRFLGTYGSQSRYVIDTSGSNRVFLVPGSSAVEARLNNLSSRVRCFYNGDFESGDGTTETRVVLQVDSTTGNLDMWVSWNGGEVVHDSSSTEPSFTPATGVTRYVGVSRDDSLPFYGTLELIELSRRLSTEERNSYLRRWHDPVDVLIGDDDEIHHLGYDDSVLNEGDEITLASQLTGGAWTITTGNNRMEAGNLNKVRWNGVPTLEAGSEPWAGGVVTSIDPRSFYGSTGSRDWEVGTASQNQAKNTLRVPASQVGKDLERVLVVDGIEARSVAVPIQAIYGVQRAGLGDDFAWSAVDMHATNGSIILQWIGTGNTSAVGGAISWGYWDDGSGADRHGILVALNENTLRAAVRYTSSQANALDLAVTGATNGTTVHTAAVVWDSTGTEVHYLGPGTVQSTSTTNPPRTSATGKDTVVVFGRRSVETDSHNVSGVFTAVGLNRRLSASELTGLETSDDPVGDFIGDADEAWHLRPASSTSVGDSIDAAGDLEGATWTLESGSNPLTVDGGLNTPV